MTPKQKTLAMVVVAGILVIIALLFITSDAKAGTPNYCGPDAKPSEWNENLWLNPDKKFCTRRIPPEQPTTTTCRTGENGLGTFPNGKPCTPETSTSTTQPLEEPKPVLSSEGSAPTAVKATPAYTG